jgi:RNA polymerase sigma-70 factor (ECF subfamily)
MDRDEISRLYRRLGPLIYRRCLKLLRDPDNARDATQEVFVRAVKHKETLKADRECLPWLYRVATNYCLNFIRDRKPRDDRAPEEVLQASSGERRLAARQQVFSILGEFDLKTQQIAVYSLLDGMTQEEIAEVMGLSRKTVGKKLSRFTDHAKELIA